MNSIIVNVRLNLTHLLYSEKWHFHYFVCLPRFWKSPHLINSSLKIIQSWRKPTLWQQKHQQSPKHAVYDNPIYFSLLLYSKGYVFLNCMIKQLLKKQWRYFKFWRKKKKNWQKLFCLKFSFFSFLWILEKIQRKKNIFFRISRIQSIMDNFAYIALYFMRLIIILAFYHLFAKIIDFIEEKNFFVKKYNMAKNFGA